MKASKNNLGCESCDLVQHHLELLAYRDAVMVVVPAWLQPFWLAVLVGAQKKTLVLVLYWLDRHVEWETLGVLQAAERALHRVFSFLANKRSHVQNVIGVFHKFRVPMISPVVENLLLLGSGLDNKNHKQNSKKKWQLELMPHRRAGRTIYNYSRTWQNIRLNLIHMMGEFRCALCSLVIYKNAVQLFSPHFLQYFLNCPIIQWMSFE